MPDQPKYHRRVLVLGRDIRAFLSVIRSLGRADIEVHAAMCAPDDLALRSRYLFQYHELPQIDEPGDCCEAICQLTSRIRFDLIIPTNDESAMLVQQHQEALSQHAKPYCLNDKAFDIAFDKIKSSQLAEALGLMIPRQQTLDLRQYQPGTAPNIQFPLVAKPPSSYAGDELSSRREVQHIANQSQLDLFVRKHLDWQEVLLQEYFSGVGAGIEILAQDGIILYAFQHIRVHEPLDGGASSYRKSMELNPILVNATKKLMRALEYSGVAMVEYKLNTDTGEWIFIEINGRFWGSLPLGIAAGADFPLYLYQQQVEGKTQFDPNYKANVYSRNLLRDLYWIADNLAARRQRPPPKGSVPLTEVLGEVTHIVMGRDHIDSFAMDDLKPGLGELAIISRQVTDKLKSLFIQGLYSIPWYRRHQAQRIRECFQKANTVEIVCYGNICRSAFAAPYLAERVSDKTIRSSGVHPEDGRSSPDIAIEAASLSGVDLQTHRSELLNRQRVNEADLILIFDKKNQQALSKLYPDANYKIHYLGFLLERGDVEISDPYAHSLETFRVTYDRIGHALDRLIAPTDL